jgi:hypothetical protein
MKWLRIAAARVRGLLRGEAVERDIDEELSCHIEMLTDENMRSGLTREEARRQALRSCRHGL